MENKIAMSCNIRFNAKNSRHMKAAKVLSMIGLRYKTAFIAVAIEAYLKNHQDGIDSQELCEVQRETWGGKPKNDVNLPAKGIISLPSEPARKPDESQDNINKALDYYNI